MRHLLALRRPRDGIRVVNAGVAGDTTAQMLGRFSAVIAARPDWIVCLAGTNDARRQRPSPRAPLVSGEETARNLRALHHLAATRTGARWAWITPPPIIEEQIAADPHFTAARVTWRDRDVAAVAAMVRRRPELVVDLQPRFGRPADPALLLPDGLHPSLAG